MFVLDASIISGAPYFAILSYTIDIKKSIWKMLKFYVANREDFLFFGLRNGKAKKRYKNIEKKKNAYCLFEILVLVCIW